VAAFTRLLDARPDFLLAPQACPVEPELHDPWAAHDSGE
jgi:hypothetical protein